MVKKKHVWGEPAPVMMKMILDRWEMLTSLRQRLALFVLRGSI